MTTVNDMNDQDANDALKELTILMTQILGDCDAEFDKGSLVASLNDALDDMEESHRFQAFVVDGDDPGELVLQIRARPAVDQLAEHPRSDPLPVVAT